MEDFFWECFTNFFYYALLSACIVVFNLCFCVLYLVIVFLKKKLIAEYNETKEICYELIALIYKIGKAIWSIVTEIKSVFIFMRIVLRTVVMSPYNLLRKMLSSMRKWLSFSKKTKTYRLKKVKCSQNDKTEHPQRQLLEETKIQDPLQSSSSLTHRPGKKRQSTQNSMSWQTLPITPAKKSHHSADNAVFSDPTLSDSDSSSLNAEHANENTGVGDVPSNGVLAQTHYEKQARRTHDDMEDKTQLMEEDLANDELSSAPKRRKYSYCSYIS